MRLRLAWALALVSVTGAGCTVTSGTDAGRPVDAPRMDAGRDAPVTTCTAVADCDDSLPCTNDNCAPGGVCEHLALDALCPAGQVCDLTRGCTTSSSDCTTPEDCMVGRGFCDGLWTCIVGTCYASEPRDCDDGNECTVDSCDPAASGGAGGCSYVAATGCDAGAVPTDGGAPVCDPFVPATGYSGTFRVSPRQLLDCSFLLSYNMQDVTFSVSGSTLTVTGAPSFPAVLTGAVPTGSTFTVSGSSGCGAYTLTGTFSCANVFMGTFSRTLSSDCAICGSASAPILGRR